MYFLCEIEDKDKIYKIAVLKDKVIGISNSLIKSQLEIDFCLFEDRLYPIYTHNNLKNPNLKFYFVFEKFAFGITRIIKESEQHPKKIENNELYSGVIIEEDSYFVYNLEKISPAHAVQNSLNSKKIKNKEEKKDYLVLDKTFAIHKTNVLSIMENSEIIIFPTSGYIGFVEYKEILPVKRIKDGKYVVITRNGAFQCKNIEITNGKLFQNKKNKILKCSFGNLKILE
ncbi:hypothetical protein SU69_05845 [Thermosipho melanesiensis]|uniref:Uncharacterized protein n=2 Tax=Thermosipho melanesiensis TaxID=46541 RepID=A6LM53_THEM4|nr:hypothetical protein [Thermosipho melanesiensis]ABR31004.1 hypothetical protein Tmel_1149 [Thermosipho melanesiensis BI429]APT74098.1 hypothetical protein BW47_06140 [Thermosipho melanesiensis]OOC36045.1 hypothetical protein SU68_05915 [Thermosipho melanesiensis]OOC36862.1 hypothetical protein SU69_05845 [Thermosipho melanesiensis]OOC37613.1 hypothetical protein SU70_05855 [Thermosipho melanesiensis]